MIILITGVAGSGKTTIGQKLARELRWTFLDADDFHPPANVAKMSAGQPLDDADRRPWLAALRTRIQSAIAQREDAVIACSALKERYRATLVVEPTQVRLAFLHGTPELLRSRLASRQNHFMRPQMLDSQLAALEPPSDALQLDAALSPETLVSQIRRVFGV